MSEIFSKDTDGFMARHFDRKISGVISRFLISTPITPNQITIFVTFLGMVAAWHFAQPGYTYKLYASILFLVTSILDGCDGEVARAKQLTTKLGGWLDLWGDNLVHMAVFYGLGIGLYRDTGNPDYQKLGALAVMGTLLSATLASYQTWRTGQSGFTSVDGHAPAMLTMPRWRQILVRLSDALARRDFIYGVVVLAAIGQLQWFLWACAIGSIAYAGILGVLCLTTRPSVENVS